MVSRARCGYDLRSMFRGVRPFRRALPRHGRDRGLARLRDADRPCGAHRIRPGRLVDISSKMIEAARSAHPELRFDVGSLTRLPSRDRSLSGVVYWYSIIATPPDELDTVWQELDRVLSSSGRILVGIPGRRQRCGRTTQRVRVGVDTHAPSASCRRRRRVVGPRRFRGGRQCLPASCVASRDDAASDVRRAPSTELRVSELSVSELRASMGIARNCHCRVPAELRPVDRAVRHRCVPRRCSGCGRRRALRRRCRVATIR